mgnify:FL=1
MSARALSPIIHAPSSVQPHAAAAALKIAGSGFRDPTTSEIAQPSTVGVARAALSGEGTARRDKHCRTERERAAQEASRPSAFVLIDDKLFSWHRIGARHGRATLARNEEVAIDAFPSVKMASFTVFQKFYVNRNRRPSPSDAFDVIISSSMPYMDAVITERHQREVSRQAKRHDPRIADLESFTLADSRDGPPT